MAIQSAKEPSVQREIDAIEALFAPALKDRDDNRKITEKLVADASSDNSQNGRGEILRKAGDMLYSLHNAVMYDSESQPEDQAYDSTLLLAVYKLLDYLSLEGVYPSLPAGIGSLKDRRSRSLFYRNNDPAYRPLEGEDLLAPVLGCFAPILKDVGEGIEPMLRHRILSDLIAAYAWIAHRESRPSFPDTFATYLNQLPLAALLSSYTALLRGTSVEWFKSIIAEQLSLLPLRPNGVRSTIDFIAASHQAPRPVDEGGAQPSSGPSLSLEALQQASRLLSSVPKTMTAETYFPKIAPQLLDLLDDQSEKEMRRAAGFVIGSGILGKRSIGSPGTVGWALFAEPILQAFNPQVPTTGRKRKASPTAASIDNVVVSQDAIGTALARLSAILSHPIPGLTGRLMRPIVLPLWAMVKYKGLTFAATETSKSAFALLSRFLSLVGTPKDTYYLADHVQFGGGASWELGPGENGGIAIRERNRNTSDLRENDFAKTIGRVDYAVQCFCRLLAASKIKHDDISALFAHIAKRQLGPQDPVSNQLSDEPDPLATFSQTKLMEALMDKFQDVLTKTSGPVLELVDQVLQRYLASIKERREKTQSTKLSMNGLANIVRHEDDATDASPDQDSDTVSIALSLLNALAGSDESSAAGLLSRFQSTQQHLAEINGLLAEEDPLKSQIGITLALLNAKAAEKSSTMSHQVNADASDLVDTQQALNLVLTDLTSELPPVRRSALHALQSLIKAPNTSLDVPPLALVLLDLLRTDKEEFVYLAVMQTTVQLALRRDFGFVVRVLANTFQDVEEATGVDGRLRIGEALATLVDEIGGKQNPVTKVGEVTRSLAQTLIIVTARRGQRKREFLERQREERLQRRKRKAAERAWGGEVPDVPQDINQDDAEYEALNPAERAKRVRDLDAIEQVVKGWEDTGHEEDVRIRASALSILGRLLEHCGAMMTGQLVAEAIELALSILTLELAPSHAIIRRASALALFGILKAADAKLESGKTSSTPILQGEEWIKAEKVLHWVKDTDDDSLTVGHAEAVLEGLEAIRMKMIARVGEVAATSREGELDGKLRGLSVNPALVEEVDEEVKDTDMPPPPRKRMVIEELD